jgi:hypothetical protein
MQGQRERRLVEKLLPLALLRAAKRGVGLEQHPQPDACDIAVGEVALHSWDCRPSADVVEQCGAVRITRGAMVSHTGHSNGRSHSAMGRMEVNGPQSSQRYS